MGVPYNLPHFSQTKADKMIAKKLMTAVCAAALCGGVWAADEAKPVPTSTANAEKEVQEEEKDDSLLAGRVAVEAGLALDSRFLTYSVIDGKDPIVRPSGRISFFDWVYFNVEALFDVTKGSGKRGGYGNRAGRWTILDSSVGLAHEFDCGETLGALSVDFSYMYESTPRYRDDEGNKYMKDTQYLDFRFSLDDLWFEPALWIERDLMADDGTYVNLEIGHTFPLIDDEGEDEDPVLAFRPSVGQGLGNTQRAAGYFVKHKGSEEPLDHGGLMDTTIKGELTWNICEHLSLSGYIAYSDYWLDSNMRDGARAHNAAWGHGCDHSWNLYGGIALGVSF